MVHYAVTFSLRPAIPGYSLSRVYGFTNNWPRSLVAMKLVLQLGLGAL